MSLSRVIIKNYKSIKHCDVTLSGLNVLIGENGTGKTNLLEAINYFYNNKLNLQKEFIGDKKTEKYFFRNRQETETC